jgi:hypothetical protein
MSQTKTELLAGRDSPLSFPSGNGTSGQYLQTDGSGGLSWQTVTDTGARWTTSSVSLIGQSSVSITGIPSTATQIIVTLNTVQMAGNFDWGIRAGTSSGLASSNYDAMRGYVGGSLGGEQSSDRWFGYGTASTAFLFNGRLLIYKISGNVWHGDGFLHYNGGGTGRITFGKVSLGGTLDRIGFITLGSTFSTGNAYLSYMEP